MNVSYLLTTTIGYSTPKYSFFVCSAISLIKCVFCIYYSIVNKEEQINDKIFVDIAYRHSWQSIIVIVIGFFGFVFFFSFSCKSILTSTWNKHVIMRFDTLSSDCNYVFCLTQECRFFQSSIFAYHIYPPRSILSFL